MKLTRYTGLYLLLVVAAFTLCSLWQLRHGSSRVDFSYIIVLPIAIGLICRRRWAVLASAILGFGGSITGIGIAGVYSIFGMSGLEVRLGPILLIEPSVVALWSLILLFVLAIGLPMAGPYLMKKEIGHFA